jgi:hypothetical protein
MELLDFKKMADVCKTFYSISGCYLATRFNLKREVGTVLPCFLDNCCEKFISCPLPRVCSLNVSGEWDGELHKDH